MHTEDEIGYCYTKIEITGPEVRCLHAALSSVLSTMVPEHSAHSTLEEFHALLGSSIAMRGTGL